MAFKLRTKLEAPDLSGTQLYVVIDGDNLEELTSMKARNAVLTFARQLGFNGSGLASIPHPYPVGADDKPDEKMILDPANHPFDHWQAEFELNAGLR